MSNNIKKPNFFIIGAPKCGTTALQAYLSYHPSIFLAPDEQYFFSKDLNIKFWNSEQEYLDLFNEENSHEAIAIGEKSVSYLYSQDAVYNILKFNPKAKFIVMLRNPIDMAYSLYSQSLYDARENVGDFQTAWYLQKIRRNAKKIPKYCREPKLLQYGNICKTGEQMKRLYSLVSEEKVFVIIFDDFTNDTRSVYERVLRFLDIPTDKREEFSVINRSKELKLPLFRVMIRCILGIKRALGISQNFGIFNYINRIKFIKRGSPLSLSENFRKELQNYFRNDILLLQDILQNQTPSHLRTKSVDLSHWLT